MISPPDEQHLRRAIELARSARDNGNHPFGALLVDRAGVVLTTAENTVETDRDITAHAELNLVRTAARDLGDEQLKTSTLYTSTEPCPMCAGAISWAGIARVVFAMPGQGGISAEQILTAGARVVTVDGPALLVEAAAVHDG